MKIIASILTGGLVLTACATAQTPATVAQQPVQPGSAVAVKVLPEESQRLLAAHNAERTRVGVPPLVWDDRLAASAAAYGPVIARIDRLQHSPRAGRPGVSENLMRIGRGPYTPEQMVGQWVAERQWFKPGVFPDNSTTGDWLDTSHYTQLIWPATTKVGCAVHSAPRWTYLICHYSPKGNRDGVRLPR